jgi:hypothetical protein
MSPSPACQQSAGSGLPWRLHAGQHVELLQEPEYVLVRPLLHGLSVGNPMDDHGRHLQVVAGSRNARQIGFVLAICRQASHHLVALGDLVLNLVIAAAGVGLLLDDDLPLGLALVGIGLMMAWWRFKLAPPR